MTTDENLHQTIHSHQVTSKIIDCLFDNFDKQLLEKRVDARKDYWSALNATQNIWLTVE
jgi:hypothetical protein